MSIEWKDSYRIGNDTIDQQHQHLFELANALSKADTQADLRLGAIHLYKYVREHFAYEEALMRSLGYPGYANHVAAHNQILAHLNDISQDIRNNECDKHEIQKVMTDWALDHIALNDTKIANYISRS